MIKKFILTAWIIFVIIEGLCPSILAFTSEQVHYQGYITDSSGVPISDVEIPMGFRIYNVPTGSTPLWEETQNVDVQNGIYDVILGDGTTNIGSFNSELFANRDLWIEIEVADEIVNHRQKIKSVAYAMHANEAEIQNGSDSIGFFTSNGGVTFNGAVTSGSVLLRDLQERNGSYGQQITLSGRSSSGDQGGGIFVWHSDDLAKEVSCDPECGVYCPPISDTTGASGAWVRQYDRLLTSYFGAGSGKTADQNTTAIQAALDFAYAIGEGSPEVVNNVEVTINDALHIGSYVHFVPGVIEQTTNTVPIIIADKDNINYSYSINNGTLSYRDAPLTSAGSAIQLGDTNDSSYNFEIRDIVLWSPYYGLYLPELPGSHVVLGVIESIKIRQSVSKGIYIAGDGSKGSNVSITIRNCYVAQTNGSEISTSGGICLNNIQGLVVENCNVDHIQKPSALYIGNCHGVVNSFSVESSDFDVSTGINAYFRFSSSSIQASSLKANGNNVIIRGNAGFYPVRLEGGTSVVSIHELQDLDSTVSDKSSSAYRTVSSASEGDIVYITSYTDSGNTPFSSLSDDSDPMKVRFWDGKQRALETSAGYILYDDSPPTSGTWSTGDSVVNTAPSSGGVWGWICVSDGTPGTWEPIYIITGTPSAGDVVTWNSNGFAEWAKP